MIKLGCMSLSYKNAMAEGRLDLFEFIDKAYELRLDGIDIHSGALESEKDTYLQKVRRHCLQRGLAISYLGISNDFGKCDEEIPEEIDMVKHWIDVAAKLHIPMVRIFAAWERDDTPKDITWSRMIDSISEVVEHADNQGIAVGLHNHNHGCVTRTGDDVLQILKQINKTNFTHILDTGQYAGSPGASGAKGKVYGNGANGNTKLKMFEEIDVSSIQGLEPAYYTASLSLLENQDEYDYELLIAPGVTIQNGAGAVTSMISTVDTRGDAMAIVDTRNYGSTISQAVTSAATQDTSYAATYWPWVQVLSNETGKLVFVPASTVMAGVYATNDRLGAEWFAPAGFNRGGVGGTIQAERKLSPSQRDTLYLAKINPIATFPGQGPVVFGQKTLQTKSTSLDRVNVRRLLIELKRVVGQVAESLLFEQNTQATRNRFLNQVNPYLESVQQRQGLYAYRVVMDSTNNTAEVIDRNQMVGQIFIQPTRTAEFIILDFNITPTGVEF